MTVSFWRRTSTVPAPAFAPAPPRSCEVGVIGAGIAGVSAALHLERRGLSACILERESIGAGASGRNAGFLMRGCADNYAVACETYGRARAAELWRLTEQTLAGLRAEGIDELPSVQRTPSCLLAFDEAERDELLRSATLLREDGFAVEWIDGADGARRGIDDVWVKGRPLGALVNPRDGAANSVDLLHFLASRVRSPIARAAVLAIDETAGGVRIRTDAGDIACAHALVCANAYAPMLIPSLAPLVAPRRGQMLAIRPKAPGAAAGGPRLTMSYYANRGYEYFRQPRRASEDGGGASGGGATDGTIVFGGARRAFADAEVGYDDATTDEVQGALEGFIHRFLGLVPADYDVLARWSGTMGFTPDALPKIAPISDRRRAWFVGGFTGHGMSMGYETTRLALGAMFDGAPNPFPR